MEVVVPERLEMLREPLRVVERSCLVELCVIGGPTPPAHGRRRRNAGMVQIANEARIGFELAMIVGIEREQKAFRLQFFPCRNRYAELDLIPLGRSPQRPFLLILGHARVVGFVGGQARSVWSLGDMRFEDSKKLLRSERAHKEAQS